MIQDISDNMLYTVSEVICVGCCGRWLCCRPQMLMLQEIECPYCGTAGMVVETGQKLNDKKQEKKATIVTLYEGQ